MSDGQDGVATDTPRRFSAHLVPEDQTSPELTVDDAVAEPGGESLSPGPSQPREWHYPLHLGAAVVVRATESGFSCGPRRTFAAATPAWGLSQNDLAAARMLVHSKAAGFRSVPGSDPGSALGITMPAETGLADSFVDLLRHEVIPPVPGFRVVRLVPPPEAAGERPVTDEQDAPIVVGERVVVTWVRSIQDADHEAPLTLRHLDAVQFFEVPDTYGMLLWTTPGGREVPVAWATKYLPRSRDGWDWCLDLTQRALGLGTPASGPLGSSPGAVDPWQHDFPARLGRFTAKLHLALATPSEVIPAPTEQASPDLIRAWRSAALAQVTAAEEVAEKADVEGVGEVLLPRVAALRAAVDQLEEIAQEADREADGDQQARSVHIQRVHGDLHIGQILRWPGGMVVVDFHPNPQVEIDGLSVGQTLQPAARDLARLMRSLDHVARVVDKGSDFALTDRVDAWSRAARESLLESYRTELAAAGRPELLDERLLPAFEAEQLSREVAYATENLPSWVYAPLGGLWQSFPCTQSDGGEASADSTSGDRPHGRHARVTS